MFWKHRQSETISPEQRKELFLNNYATLEDACHQLEGLQLALNQRDLKTIESVLNKINLAKSYAENPEDRPSALLIGNLLVLINPILKDNTLPPLVIHEI